MNIELSVPTVIFEDNQSIICMAHNPQFHGRTKNIGIKYHYVREQVNMCYIMIMVLVLCC